MLLNLSSLVVSMLNSESGDPGSIPGRGTTILLSFLTWKNRNFERFLHGGFLINRKINGTIVFYYESTPLYSRISHFDIFLIPLLCTWPGPFDEKKIAISKGTKQTIRKYFVKKKSLAQFYFLNAQWSKELKKNREIQNMRESDSQIQ